MFVVDNGTPVKDSEHLLLDKDQPDIVSRRLFKQLDDLRPDEDLMVPGGMQFPPPIAAHALRWYLILEIDGTLLFKFSASLAILASAH